MSLRKSNSKPKNIPGLTGFEQDIFGVMDKIKLKKINNVFQKRLANEVKTEKPRKFKLNSIKPETYR